MHDHADKAGSELPASVNRVSHLFKSQLCLARQAHTSNSKGGQDNFSRHTKQ